MDGTLLPLELEAKNGDASLISGTMAEEEEKLLEERSKGNGDVKLDPNFKFNKLDELLTQTQLYSEFLLEKMEDITSVYTFILKESFIYDMGFLLYFSLIVVWFGFDRILQRSRLKRRRRKKIIQKGRRVGRGRPLRILLNTTQ